MPRYYFDHCDRDAVLRDDEGVVLDGIEDAHTLAARALAEAAWDVLPGSANRELVIVIRGEAKEPLLRNRLFFETIWLQPRS